jgi:hypothetical protein
MQYRHGALLIDHRVKQDAMTHFFKLRALSRNLKKLRALSKWSKKPWFDESEKNPPSRAPPNSDSSTDIAAKEPLPMVVNGRESVEPWG